MTAGIPARHGPMVLDIEGTPVARASFALADFEVMMCGIGKWSE